MQTKEKKPQSICRIGPFRFRIWSDLHFVSLQTFLFRAGGTAELYY